MRLLLSLVLLLPLGYESLAAPTALRPQRKSRSFRVERVRRGDYVAHGPSALSKAHRKFGIAPTSFTGVDLSDFEPYEVAKSAVSTTKDSDDVDQTGEVAAKSVQSDVEFISTVTIGGQNVPMDFDTGSADMYVHSNISITTNTLKTNFQLICSCRWVLNSNMDPSYIEGHTVYHPEKSNTYKAVENNNFEISYGDSSWAKGTVCKDTVSIGGATVKDQFFGLPSTVSQSFVSDTNSNGLLGLGFSSMNTFQPGPQKTFFDNIAPDLEEPVFTSLLRSGGIGEYEFGAIDQSKYTGTLVNISVDSSNGYWQFDTKLFAVGSGSLQSVADTPTAIADTGTSLMLVSEQILNAYYGQVQNAQYSPSAGGYIYPCSAELPSLTVALGDKYQATIPGSLIKFAEIGTNTTTGGTGEFSFDLNLEYMLTSS